MEYISNFNLNLKLEKEILEIIQNFNESNNIEEGFITLLKESIKLKLESINKKILRIQDKYIKQDINNESFNIENYQIDTLKLNENEKKILLEKNDLSQYYQDLVRYQKNKSDNDLNFYYYNKFINNKFKKYNSTIRSQDYKSKDSMKDVNKIKKRLSSLEKETSFNVYEEILSKDKDNSPILTTDMILKAFDCNEWQNIKHLIFKLRIKDMLAVRLLNEKIKELVRLGLLKEKEKFGKHFWRLNNQ